MTSVHWHTSACRAHVRATSRSMCPASQMNRVGLSSGTSALLRLRLTKPYNRMVASRQGYGPLHTASLSKYECTSLQDAILDRTYYRLGTTTLNDMLKLPLKDLGVDRNLRKLPLDAVWMTLARSWWAEDLQGFEDLAPEQIWLRSLHRLDKTYFTQLGELELARLGDIQVPVWELKDMQHMLLKDALELHPSLNASMTFEELWNKDTSPLKSVMSNLQTHVTEPENKSSHQDQAKPSHADGSRTEEEHRRLRDRSIILIRTGLVPGVILAAILLDRLT